MKIHDVYLCDCPPYAPHPSSFIWRYTSRVTPRIRALRASSSSFSERNEEPELSFVENVKYYPRVLCLTSRKDIEWHPSFK